MANHHDPRLLYSISGINAYHLQNGEEASLTPSGPQTLSLLMVPTNSPFSDGPAAAAPEEDFYLHLNLPPELDLPLPATTQIYHQPPHSYLIPRWDLGPDSGAFTRIEFPSIGSGPDRVSQEDVDTFETILAQCTAFLERARAPSPSRDYKPYNPQEFKPGEAYAPGTGSGHHGQIVLVNEDDGSVVGELMEGAETMDDSKITPGEKDPVEIQISSDGKRIEVRPIEDDFLEMANHPAYRSSTLVQNAAAASRLIVTGSSYLGSMLSSSAEAFTQKTKPNPKPLNFKPATHARVRKINSMTQGVAGMSAKTVGQATKYAQNLGATLARRGEAKRKIDNENYKPGLLNKSMIAFSTIADGIAASGKHLLISGGAAATTVVGHKYGDEAGAVASELAGGVKNVGLVYIDVTGVSRRAVIKSVAKGMVVGKVSGGGQVVVGGGDGGVIPEADVKRAGLPAGSYGTTGGSSAAAGAPTGPGLIGYGNSATPGPPSYASSAGTGEWQGEKREKYR
ncbi:hypothetical protein EJ06DRAFT_528861 [Trichodelitschia bisporula]|uniref:Senescence domain-containing protein n=1 Tax=Trichodelitschia bisporula TaxID=703511 RepID=A0A6G1I0I4_9PEZI|nr:hypothetical protein EJ06DRAFT_528861 [Trichodelitschia bisporula]